MLYQKANCLVISLLISYISYEYVRNQNNKRSVMIQLVSGEFFCRWFMVYSP